MEEVARAYPKGAVHVVWDNLNTRRAQAVWDGFNTRHSGRFVFHFTPLPQERLAPNPRPRSHISADPDQRSQRSVTMIRNTQPVCQLREKLVVSGEHSVNLDSTPLSLQSRMHCARRAKAVMP